MTSGRHVINIKDQSFGSLTVLEECGRANGGALWRVKCLCGNQEVRRSTALPNEGTYCCKKCLAASRKTATPEYVTHCAMKQRCLNPCNHAYKNYGGRGITI